MTREIESSRYPPEYLEKLIRIEKNRNITSRAKRRSLHGLYSRFFRGDETVLDMGCGIGFLGRNLFDGFNGTLVQLDAQPVFLETAKTRLAGRYIAGDGHELPFRDESFDAVGGSCFLDVSYDLGAVIDEGYRVLKKGGLFFHLVDIEPAAAPILEDFFEKGVPVKGSFVGSFGSTDAPVTAISYIPKKSLAAYQKEAAGTPDQDSMIWKKYEQEVDLLDYFKDKLIAALRERFGDDSIEYGELTAHFKGRRMPEQWDVSQDHFVYVDDINRAGAYSHLPYYYRCQGRYLRAVLGCFNIYQGFREDMYLAVKKLFPNFTADHPGFTKSLEPSVTEIATVMYAVARK